MDTVFSLHHPALGPCSFQYLLDQQTVQVVIVYHQKLPSLPSGLPFFPRLEFQGLRRGLRRQRQTEPEARALTGSAVKTYLPLEQRHQALGNGQAQACPAIAFLYLALGLDEALKDARLIFQGNANAGVLDRKQHAPGVRLYAQQHLPLVGELQRVAQKIDQDLHQAMTVGAGPFGHVGVYLTAVSQVHAFDPRRKQIKGVLYRVTQSESFGVRSETPGQELRVVQHIIDDRHQVIGRLARVLQNFKRAGIMRHPLDQQTVEAQNRIQWRT